MYLPSYFDGLEPDLLWHPTEAAELFLQFQCFGVVHQTLPDERTYWENQVNYETWKCNEHSIEDLWDVLLSKIDENKDVFYQILSFLPFNDSIVRFESTVAISELHPVFKNFDVNTGNIKINEQEPNALRILVYPYTHEDQPYKVNDLVYIIDEEAKADLGALMHKPVGDMWQLGGRVRTLKPPKKDETSVMTPVSRCCAPIIEGITLADATNF